MFRKRLLPSLCALLLAPSFLLSVLASRESRIQLQDSQVSAQSATLVINEYLADPPGSASSDLIGDANGDGVRDATQDEFVELVNSGAAPLDVSSFTISDATQSRFTFPGGKVIPPGEATVVFGGGTPTEAFGNAAANGLVFAIGGSGLSLNNGGDTITVKDNMGATVATLTYTSTEGNADQSITRSPDVTGGFVTHSTATGSGGALFSPGSKVNGAPFTTIDPVIDSISPDSVIAGSGDSSIVVTGMNFHNGDQVRVDGTPISTGFVNDKELDANIPASVTNTPGVYAVTVRDPGGAISNSASFNVLSEMITSISPEGVVAGSGDVSITVIGKNFRGSARVRVGGTPIFTAFFSSTELDAVIPASTTNVPGSYSITVENPGGVISNAVTFTVLARIGINEYLADPPDGLAGDANGDGVRDSSNDEFVEILNRSTASIDVSGFTISDNDAQRFIFPSGTLIPAGEAAVIFGGGTPHGDFGNARANGLVFTANLSLNNGGDTITFKDGTGAQIEKVVFGATEGGAGQSINRNPDGAGVGFSNHSTIAASGGRLFSPGTQVDGTPFTSGPRITSIHPDTATQGDPQFDMTVNGNNFEGGSQVLIDGQPLTTAFVSANQLIGHVTATVLATSGLHQVQVRNESGNRSNSTTLTVLALPPSVISITPRTVTVGASFTLFITGSNFVSGATVLIDGASVTRTFVSSHDMRATVPSSIAAVIGSHAVVVVNPDGKQSNSTTFDVVAPATLLSSITPSTAIVGGPGFTMFLKGSNFKSGAAVFFDQTPLASTFVSSTQLSAEVSASLISSIKVHTITVQNPGESPSNELVFQVVADSPLIGTIDPASVIAGGADLTVTITGKKFQAGAVVRVIENIQPTLRLNTTFFDSERVQAIVPSALIQLPGLVSLAVENTDGGVSNAIALQVLIKDPLVINEYLADPAAGLDGDANGDGTRSSSQDEFIELLNRSAQPFDISGYTLADADAVRHVFPAGTVLPPFEAAVVFGGGAPMGSFGNAAENNLVFKASMGGLSLNNGGDTITLQDAQGHIVQQIIYTSVEGGAGQSINRNPDGDGATFSLHTNVAGDVNRLFSPGTKAAGQTFSIKPRIGAITPGSVRVGSLSFTLIVSGSNFLPGAIVFLGDTPLETVYRSDARLEAQVSANLLTEGGGAAIVVKNPKGETSSIARLLIVDDPPRATRITPEKAGTGADSLDVSIIGERFQRGAGVLVQSIPVNTRFVSSTMLVATVPSSFFAKAASLSLVILNADGNQSNALTLTVENGPLITRLSRSKIRAGAGTFELTVGGVAFKPGIVLFAGDAPLSTTYIGETSFTARIPAELINQPGLLTLQARDPDGGRSNTVKFKVVQ